MEYQYGRMDLSGFLCPCPLPMDRQIMKRSARKVNTESPERAQLGFFVVVGGGGGGGLFKADEIGFIPRISDILSFYHPELGHYCNAGRDVSKVPRDAHRFESLIEGWPASEGPFSSVGFYICHPGEDCSCV